MTGYIARRLLMLLPVLLGVTLVVFGVMSLVPGDPALAILGPYATPERLAELRAELGLDQPWPLRYGHWLADLLAGDLGRSLSLEQPVADAVLGRLGPTLLLAGAALLLAVLLGLAAGLLAALRHNRATDRLVTLAVLLGISLPAFWLGLLLILLFAVWLGWLPASGMTTVWLDDQGWAVLPDLLRHLLLPALSLALVAAGVIGRIGRAVAMPLTGSQPSQTPNSRISSRPSQNGGNEIPSSTARVTSRSVARLCRSAATSPAASPSSAPSSSAAPASSSVGPRRSKTASATGRSNDTERPMSPCNRPPSQPSQRSGQGWSRCSVARRSARRSGVA